METLETYNIDFESSHEDSLTHSSFEWETVDGASKLSYTGNTSEFPFIVKLFETVGEVDDDFAVSIKVNPDIAKSSSWQGNSLYSNALIVYDFKDADNYRFACFRNAAAQWTFERVEGGSRFLEYSSPMTEPSVRGKIGNLSTVSGSNIMKVSCEGHSLKIGDTVRFRVYKNNIELNMDINGMSIPYASALVVSEVNDEDNYEISLDTYATASGTIDSYEGLGITYVNDKEVALRATLLENGNWLLRFYDLQDNTILVQQEVPPENFSGLSGTIGVGAQYSETLFLEPKQSEEALNRILDVSENADISAYTVQEGNITVDSLNILLDLQEDSYTIESAPTPDGTGGGFYRLDENGDFDRYISKDYVITSDDIIRYNVSSENEIIGSFVLDNGEEVTYNSDTLRTIVDNSPFLVVGDLIIDDGIILGLVDPTEPDQAVNKAYADSLVTQGLPGDTGPIGPQGIAGVAGPTGSVGPQGATGPQGVSGVVGLQGISGIAGVTGPQGEAGVSGPQGESGMAGPQGISGVAGPKGSIGPQGVAGVAGPKGEAGVHGLTGAIGPKGEAGVHGLTGAIGPKGETGLQGVAGVAGLKGEAGMNGVAGVAGPQGETGLQGVAGVIGPMGVAGDDFDGHARLLMLECQVASLLAQLEGVELVKTTEKFGQPSCNI